ncbi:MAG TPA: AraC family transcriptional regulator [Bacilli bacterium]
MRKSLLKERRTHGTPQYPVSIYAIDCPASEPLLDLHWHEELEFLLVTEGEAVFRVDLRDYALKAGEAIFVNSGMLHSGQVRGTKACSFKAVVFHPQLFNSSAIDAAFEKYILPIIRKERLAPVHLSADTVSGAELLDLLGAIFTANANAAPACELITKGLLHLAMGKLFQLGKPSGRSAHAPALSGKLDRLKNVLTYIENHFQEPIRLRDLAAIVSMSEAHFCRFFKEITNKTPIEFINRHRVQQAARLLQETNLKITSVALDVGYNNPSYFINMFKRFYGCTPHDYRRRFAAAGN